MGAIVTKPKLQGIGFGTEWQAEDIEETISEAYRASKRL